MIKQACVCLCPNGGALLRDVVVQHFFHSLKRTMNDILRYTWCVESESVGHGNGGGGGRTNRTAGASATTQRYGRSRATMLAVKRGRTFTCPPANRYSSGLTPGTRRRTNTVLRSDADCRAISRLFPIRRRSLFPSLGLTPFLCGHGIEQRPSATIAFDSTGSTGPGHSKRICGCYCCHSVSIGTCGGGSGSRPSAGIVTPRKWLCG